MGIIKNGLYCVSESYFDDFKCEWFCDNKGENRPYYITFIDKDNISWLIPLSTRVDKYKAKILADEEKYGMCLFYYIGKIMGKENAFLIGDMFPVTDKYIKKPYTFSGVHYVVQNKITLKEIQKRSARYLTLVKQKKLIPKVDIMGIKEKLLIDSVIKI